MSCMYQWKSANPWHFVDFSLIYDANWSLLELFAEVDRTRISPSELASFFFWQFSIIVSWKIYTETMEIRLERYFRGRNFFVTWNFCFVYLPTSESEVLWKTYNFVLNHVLKHTSCCTKLSKYVLFQVSNMY